MPRRQEPYRNFRGALDRLQEGGEYCSGGEAEAAASPALIEFAGELKRRPRRDARRRRLLPHPKSWRVLLFDAARAGSKTVEIATSAGSRANSAAIDAAGIQAKLNLVVEAAGSGPKTASDTIGAAR